MITALILILLAIATQTYKQDFWRSVALVTLAGLLWLFPLVSISAWILLWLAQLLVG